MEVTLIRWPEEADTRDVLRQTGKPRVLLLVGGSAPPTPVDDLEGWIRVPVSDADLRARMEWLARRIDPGPQVMSIFFTIRASTSRKTSAPVEGKSSQPLQTGAFTWNCFGFRRAQKVGKRQSTRYFVSILNPALSASL